MNGQQTHNTANHWFPYWKCAPVKYKPAQPVMPVIHKDAETFIRKQLYIDPDPKQTWLLKEKHSRMLINCSRQWGKSTITAAIALHRLLTEPGKTILVVCPSQRQSAIFVGIVKGFVTDLGMRVRGDGENRCSVLLPNGSRIIGLPGRSGHMIRGFRNVIMLIVDEASRLPDHVFFSAYPAVSQSKADIWALSTPYGKQGFFYNCWANGGDEWERLSAPATECPRIGAEEVEKARRLMGDDWVRQEYLCEFVDIEGTIFDRDRIEEAFTREIDVLGGPEWSG